MSNLDFQQLLEQAIEAPKLRRINSHPKRGYSYFFSTKERNFSYP